jgi:hypothetical protein
MPGEVWLCEFEMENAALERHAAAPRQFSLTLGEMTQFREGFRAGRIAGPGVPNPDHGEFACPVCRMPVYTAKDGRIRIRGGVLHEHQPVEPAAPPQSAGAQPAQAGVLKHRTEVALMKLEREGERSRDAYFNAGLEVAASLFDGRGSEFTSGSGFIANGIRTFKISPPAVSGAGSGSCAPVCSKCGAKDGALPERCPGATPEAGPGAGEKRPAHGMHVCPPWCKRPDRHEEPCDSEERPDFSAPKQPCKCGDYTDGSVWNGRLHTKAGCNREASAPAQPQGEIEVGTESNLEPRILGYPVSWVAPQLAHAGLNAAEVAALRQMIVERAHWTRYVGDPGINEGATTDACRAAVSGATKGTK